MDTRIITINERLIIEFIAGVGLFVNALSLNGASVTVANDSEMLGPVTVAVAISEVVENQIVSNVNVEEAVREYFKHTPDLISVAWCESRFRHFDEAGEIHRGRVNSDDIGVMQVNTVYHLEAARRLNIDLYTLLGNMEYAMHLYRQQGLQPWSASQPCWNKFVTNTSLLAYVE